MVSEALYSRSWVGLLHHFHLLFSILRLFSEVWIKCFKPSSLWELAKISNLHLGPSRLSFHLWTLQRWDYDTSHVSSQLQLADMQIKAMSRDHHYSLVHKLMFVFIISINLRGSMKRVPNYQVEYSCKAAFLEIIVILSMVVANSFFPDLPLYISFSLNLFKGVYM